MDAEHNEVTARFSSRCPPLLPSLSSFLIMSLITSDAQPLSCPPAPANRQAPPPTTSPASLYLLSPLHLLPRLLRLYDLRLRLPSHPPTAPVVPIMSLDDLLRAYAVRKANSSSATTSSSSSSPFAPSASQR
ncbi:hypothetical protein DXG01_007278 [Tephrocybe rancida]|nr:hypothetical protein DXG01_007278 [Tephrocybe rancida]